MTKDTGKQVLDAFRVEHREQQEQIRALLARLQPGEDVTDDARVRDAFRLAHSLKGGARVCDLRDAERLGHGLETVLDRLGRGGLPVTERVLATVNFVLDCLEDWMTALDRDQEPPDVSEALAAIERVLDDASTPDPSASAAERNTAQLVSVFRREHEQHAAHLRQLLDDWQRRGGACEDEQLVEAARVAHTLAGAAAVVDLRSVETTAGRLEQLFRAIRAGAEPLDPESLRQINEGIENMAEAVRRWPGDAQTTPPTTAEKPIRSPGAQSPAEDHGDREAATASGVPEAAAAGSATGHETVRVSVDSLDRLMRSSSEMLAANQHVARLARRLASLEHEAGDLEREREAFRRAASSRLHQLTALPEFERIVRYLEVVDRQVSSLAKQTRQLSAAGRRVAWQLRARSSQVGRDVHEARLVPAASLFQGFRKMVRDLAKSEGKEIHFQAVGLEVRADRRVLQELKDPIMHVLRNCVSHGIEPSHGRRTAGKAECGRVSISLEIAGGRLIVVIEDDGRGIDLKHVRQQAVKRGLMTAAVAANGSTEETLSLVFEPGFSTADSVTELAGRGMGLSIVQDAVTRMQGHVTLSPRPEGGLRVTLSVPVYVSTHRVLLVASGDQTFAIPTHAIECCLRTPKDKRETMEGQPIVTYERRPIRLFRLSDVLDQTSVPVVDDRNPTLPVVLLKSGTRFLAVAVDALLEQRDDLVLSLDEFAENRRLAGGILLDDGRIALVVHPVVLMENAQRSRTPHALSASTAREPTAPAKVLIVDDSFTTRTLEKNILESQGYDVCVAIDGLEALSLLRQQRFALVITDIEMPRMDGFALLEQMKADRRLANIPVVLVTSRDRREDQQRGLDLGADAYVVKRKFDHQELLTTIRQLL